MPSSTKFRPILLCLLICLSFCMASASWDDWQRFSWGEKVAEETVKEVPPAPKEKVIEKTIKEVPPPPPASLPRADTTGATKSAPASGSWLESRFVVAVIVGLAITYFLAQRPTKQPRREFNYNASITARNWIMDIRTKNRMPSILEETQLVLPSCWKATHTHVTFHDHPTVTPSHSQDSYYQNPPTDPHFSHQHPYKSPQPLNIYLPSNATVFVGEPYARLKFVSKEGNSDLNDMGYSSFCQHVEEMRNPNYRPSLPTTPRHEGSIDTIFSPNSSRSTYCGNSFRSMTNVPTLYSTSSHNQFRDVPNWKINNLNVPKRCQDSTYSPTRNTSILNRSQGFPTSTWKTTKFNNRYQDILYSMPRNATKSVQQVPNPTVKNEIVPNRYQYIPYSMPRNATKMMTPKKSLVSDPCLPKPVVTTFSYRRPETTKSPAPKTATYSDSKKLLSNRCSFTTLTEIQNRRQTHDQSSLFTTFRKIPDFGVKSDSGIQAGQYTSNSNMILI